LSTGFNAVVVIKNIFRSQSIALKKRDVVLE